MNIGEFILREHQVRAIEEARALVAKLLAAGEPPRVVVVAPCGAGKTIMSSALIGGAKNKGRSSIFMASGRQLIYQKSKTLNRAGIGHAILMAGEEDNWWQSAVLVASKDTYTARAFHTDRIQKETRDLWIVDEAHRGMGGEWAAILPNDNKTVVIGFTATPALANGKGLGAYYKGMVQAATYAELLKAKLLVPCRVFAPWSIDTRGIKKSSDGDWAWSQIESRFNKKVLIGNVVETWKKLGEDRPTACFASGVEHSIGLCHEFNNAGIPAKHIDATTPQEEREETYSDLRTGRIKVVTNFGVLTVGWDEPSVSCGILGFATDSLTKYLQVVGRVLRIFEGKQDALVIDHGDNVRRHGWPTDDHDWSLNPEEKVQEREIKTRDKGKHEPICCSKCGAMREGGPKCPNCGSERKRSGIKVVNEAGELEEIKPRRVKAERTGDDLRRAWMQCLAIAAHKHQSFYVARAIFRGRTKVEADGMSPMPEKHQWGMPVGTVYPGFLKSRKASA